jgi:hypothetical protein
MRIARVGTLAALLVALFAVSTTTVSAATSPLGTTVTIGTPVTLSQSRLLLSVPVDISCSSSVFTTVLSGEISVGVRQAAGQDIAQGFGDTDGLLSLCDDATHTVYVTVQSRVVPFHGGLATATSNFTLIGHDQFGSFQADSVIEGPEDIRIVGGCLFTRGC